MFTCERCGYCSIYKSNLKSHLNRKIICKPVVKDIGIDVLKEKINQKKKLIKNEPKMTPIDSQLTPIDSQLTPIDSQLTPIGSQLTPIDSQLIYKCKFCKQSYSKNSNLHRHMKKCIKKTKNQSVSLTTDESKDNEAKLSEYIKVIEKENELIEKENKLIKKEKKAMRKEIEKLIDKVGDNTQNNILNNTQNIQQNIQQNIYINNYGSENLDYLTPGYLTGLLKIPFGSTLKLLKDIHFNQNHPENHNVKIPNRKEKYALVYRDGDWKLRRKKDVISNMVDMSYNIVDCYFEDNKMILSDTKRNNFIEFQTKYDKDNILKKDIEEEVEIELLNH